MSTHKHLDQTTEEATPSQNRAASHSRLTRRQFFGRSAAAAALAVPLLGASSAPSTETQSLAGGGGGGGGGGVGGGGGGGTCPPLFSGGFLQQPPVAEGPTRLKQNGGKEIDINLTAQVLTKKCYVGTPVKPTDKKPHPNPAIGGPPWIFDQGKVGTIYDTTQGVPNDVDFRPAPTLRMNVGDTLNITFTNQLEYGFKEVCHDGDGKWPNCPHGFNNTNLHFHGSHLSPEHDQDDPTKLADNVLIKVAKGETVEYKLVIGEHQPKGTHWYHPHKHGATGLHVINGMAGAFIVEDGLKSGDTPALDFEEKILLFQQIANIGFGGATAKAPILINGLHNPTIEMYTGEIQRWRIINATMKAEAIIKAVIRKINSLAHPNTDFHVALLGIDGVGLDDVRLGDIDERPPIEFFPGRRLDLLVKAPNTVGTYGVFDLNQTSSGSMSPNDAMITIDVKHDATKKYAKVAPSPINLAPSFLKEIDWSRLGSGANRRQRCLMYGIDFDLEPMGHFIDGKPFGVGRVDHSMVLGTVEEWTIYNLNGFTHPFHIHINPFLVTDVYDPTKPDGEQLSHPMLWQDTVLLPRSKDKIKSIDDLGYVIIRHEFTDFTGKFVNHCHFLDHEDDGMMQIVEVVATEAEVPQNTGWQDKKVFPRRYAPELRGGLPKDITLEAKVGREPTKGTSANQFNKVPI